MESLIREELNVKKVRFDTRRKWLSISASLITEAEEDLRAKMKEAALETNRYSENRGA